MSAPRDSLVGMEEQVRTGVASVDAVIEAVEALDQRPLTEHAAVFTSAQERLRRALDADPDARRDVLSSAHPEGSGPDEQG